MHSAEAEAEAVAAAEAATGIVKEAYGVEGERRRMDGREGEGQKRTEDGGGPAWDFGRGSGRACTVHGD
ncbi:hypothetical protein HZH66_005192 [Vespula vulgaris]|uniref:Uncharacterized protein n=1 Tax=Vespula vulgaris TaxID=7454 RepID=A0A834KAG7_VESVU|nr:hypothetical protein HZH66_005192 [Vespula vulgaris]